MTKNSNYRKFLDQGIIDNIEQDHLRQALGNAGKSRLAGSRSILITLYKTGCRPAEALLLISRKIEREGHYIKVHLPGGVKGSLPRTIFLKDDEFARELWQYANSLHPDMFLFHAFKGEYIHKGYTKKGKYFERKETTYKLRKHIYKWFKGVVPDSINPYFLRHNFFSKLASKGAPLETLRVLKGAKKIDSVYSYSHLSTKTAKDVAKLIK